MGPGSDRADVRSRWITCEVKHRQHLPEWLKDAIRQARGYAGPAQLPVAVLHEAGARGGDDLVVLRMADFCSWFGPLAGADEERTDEDSAGGERQGAESAVAVGDPALSI